MVNGPLRLMAHRAFGQLTDAGYGGWTLPCRQLALRVRVPRARLYAAVREQLVAGVVEDGVDALNRRVASVLLGDVASCAECHQHAAHSHAFIASRGLDRKSTRLNSSHLV